MQRILRFGVALAHCHFAAKFHAAFFIDSDAFYLDKISHFHYIFHALDTKVRQFGDVNQTIFSG